MPKRVSDVYLTQTNFDEEVPNEDVINDDLLL